MEIFNDVSSLLAVIIVSTIQLIMCEYVLVYLLILQLLYYLVHVCVYQIYICSSKEYRSPRGQDSGLGQRELHVAMQYLIV